MAKEIHTHASPGRFDAGEVLRLLGSAFEGAVEAEPRGRGRGAPALVEHFAAVVRSSPCASERTTDYTDARYYLDRAAPAADAGATDVVAPKVDELPGVEQCLTATNLAELSAGSHLVASGTIVHAFGVPTRGGGTVYFFNHEPVRTAVVQLTSNAAGGGKYLGNLVDGSSSAVGSGTLAMPEGMTGGASALILNEEEDGLGGHRIGTPCYAVGRVVGRAGGLTLVVIRGALGATAGATALSGSGVSANSTTWGRNADGTPVTVGVQTRTVWDSSAGVLYAYQRTLTFDARGLLVSVSAESQVTVDVATACT